MASTWVHEVPHGVFVTASWKLVAQMVGYSELCAKIENLGNEFYEISHEKELFLRTAHLKKHISFHDTIHEKSTKCVADPRRNQHQK